jgi:hypothetical protein
MDRVSQKDPVPVDKGEPKRPGPCGQEILIQRHKAQLMLYKEALENGLNRKVDRVYIYSTGLGKEILVIDK